MYDQSIIPYYSAYYSDTWHMKPTFTLTYGMSYQIEMPPYEINGKQVQLVDQSGNAIRPRAAIAWNPSADSGILGKLIGHGKTVIRGGYSRIYGRLNGNLRGFPTWNVDAQITKDFSWRERVGATISVQITNVLNHFQPSNPTLNLDSPTSFGVVTGQSNPPGGRSRGLPLFFVR
jgi:hypothetical protein